MRFFQSQSEIHISPDGKIQSPGLDYDVRKGRAEDLFKIWQGIIFWAVLLFGSFFIFHVLHFRGLVEEEAMEIAARGRAIALGDRAFPGLIRPVYLRPGEPIGSCPADLIPPVYPRIQSVFLRLGGFTDNSAVMAGGVFFLAAALLTYALARRTLPKKGALLVFLFTFTNPVLLRSAISGLPTAFLVFLILLIFYGREALPTRISAGFSGLILGVAFLSDYSALFFLPPVLLHLILTARVRRERWLGSGVLLAGFLAATAPWLFGEVAGGRGSLGRYLGYYWKSSTVLLPGRTADGLYGIPLGSFVLPLLMAIGKIHRGLSIFCREALTVSANFLGLFFWASLFCRPNGRGPQSRRTLLLLLLAAGGGWMVFFRPRPEILVPLLPPVILYGTGFFLNLKEKFGPRGKTASRAVVAGFIVVNCAPIFFGRVPIDPLRRETVNSLNYLKTLIREEELVVTDIPARVAWYGNRRPVRLPLNPGMFREMLRDHPGTVFLLLSPGAAREDIDPTGRWRGFYSLRSGPAPEPFDQVMLLPGRLVFMGKKTVLLNRISSRW
jgi:hypothetical protein